MAGNFAGVTRWPTIRTLLSIVPAMVLAGCLHGGSSGSSAGGPGVSDAPAGAENPATPAAPATTPETPATPAAPATTPETPATPAAPATTQNAPTITGNPALTALTGTAYSFIPNVSDPEGDSLTLSVQNLPSWAGFNTSTGEISGTPGVGDSGTYSDIRISVSDGSKSTDLPPFQIVVQQDGGFSAILSWQPPTTDASGAPLVDLAGYHIHYGTQAGNPSTSVDVNNPGITSFIVENLNAGRYYFSISAYDINGNSSSRSSEVSGLVG